MINVGKNLSVDNKLLKEYYNEAMEDPNFKLLISKLNCDENLLMKYTSFLKESANEFNNCVNCKCLGECKNSLLGHAYLPRIVEGMLEFNYKKCRYLKKQDKLYSYQKNIIYYNVSSENKLADINKIDKRIKGREDAIIKVNSFLKAFPDTKGIYLSGNTGSGKTYIMMALVNELAKKNIKCAVAFWPDFLRNLKNSFDTDYMEKIEYLMNVKVLFIDDLGGEALTPWARDEVLFPILQGRLDDKEKYTLITSNLDKDLLYEHLSLTKQGVEVVKAERIISRINGLTDFVSMISKDLR